MLEILPQLIKSLSLKIDSINEERRRDEIEVLPPAELKILGQMALMANSEINQKIHLTATKDLDALIVGPWSVRLALKDLLNEFGLILDESSQEIWIPPNAKYLQFYQDQKLTVYLLDPLSVLVSKGVKAPEKNRFLIEEALTIYGHELSDLITKYKKEFNKW